MKNSILQKGQKLITKREVVISVYEMNGEKINDIINYPAGEVIEILEELENNTYLLEFWMDADVMVNEQKVTYSFDEKTIQEWLTEEEAN